MPSDDATQKIDEFIRRSKSLNDKIIVEREHWNTAVTEDAIRHFSYGIGDDNPLWLDRDYGTRSLHGSRIAPPAFLASVLYPGLHGFPMQVPLSSLISSLQFTWYRTLFEGETISASAEQQGLREYRNRKNQRLVDVLAKFTYKNAHGEVVAHARSTMSRLHNSDSTMLIDRDIYKYSREEIDRIKRIQRHENRTGQRPLSPHELQIGYELPVCVRGPLTIGDLIAWNSAIGPSYRAASLGFRDAESAPHSHAIHPETGWPYRTSQQHEDPLLSGKRGMPAPFDNTVMRFSWISTMLTNWMGDSGFLKSLQITAVEPVLYGDTIWYRGKITDRIEDSSHFNLTIRILGENQLEQKTTEGFAEILIPLANKEVEKRTLRTEQPTVTANEACEFEDSFFNNVEEYPNKTAVKYGDETLSYTELDFQSNVLMRLLKKKNIGHENRVAVLVKRSIDSIVAPIAVLKVQAVYVPLDDGYSSALVAKMIKEMQIDLVVSHSSFFHTLSQTSVPVLFIDQIIENPVEVETQDKKNVDTEKTTAYIMCTSGSAGAQKAVEVPFASLQLYLKSLRQSLKLRDSDVFLNSCSFSFSASIRQTFLPLYCGGTIILASDEQRQNQQALLNLIRNEDVTIWDTVPTSVGFCTQFLKESNNELRDSILKNSVRLIFTTGEPCKWEIPTIWADEFKHPAKFVNLYSQTETSGTTCYYEVKKPFLTKEEHIPLGIPLPNVAPYILDASMNEVPDGETGDLYIGGSRLALGYLNDPWLSANVFVKNPFSQDVSARLCKTGDKAYKSPDGTLHFAGRSDLEFNYKGYRIDPTIIEKALESLDAIDKAAVTIKPNLLRQETLVGYVCLKEGTEFSVWQIPSLLQGRIPAHMIPSAFAVVQQIPLNDRGKLDRNSLPDFATLKNEEPEEPSFTSECKLLAPILYIWKEVLDLETLTPDQSIFEIGMHSLQATQITARIYEKLGIRVDLTNLFDHPTPRELSTFLDKNLI